MIEASEQGQHFKICLLAWQTDSFSSSIAEGGGGEITVWKTSQSLFDLNLFGTVMEFKFNRAVYTIMFGVVELIGPLAIVVFRYMCCHMLILLILYTGKFRPRFILALLLRANLKLD